VEIENVFELIPLVVSNNTELSAYYPRIHQSIPGKLVDYGKTPLEILEDILKTKGESFDLQEYKKHLNFLCLWMNFLIETCRQNPTLEKPCEEYMGWIKFHYKSIEKMYKDTCDWSNKNYDPKTLASKFGKTQNNFLPPLRELHGIFYELQKGLYEKLNIQFQKPNNPVSD